MKKTSHGTWASFIAYWCSCGWSGNRSQLTRREPSGWHHFLSSSLLVVRRHNFSKLQRSRPTSGGGGGGGGGGSKLLVNEPLEFHKIRLEDNAPELCELWGVIGNVTAGQLLRTQELYKLGRKRIHLAVPKRYHMNESANPTIIAEVSPVQLECGDIAWRLTSSLGGAPLQIEPKSRHGMTWVRSKREEARDPHGYQLRLKSTRPRPRKYNRWPSQSLHLTAS